MPAPLKEPDQTKHDRDHNGSSADAAICGGLPLPASAEISLGEQLIQEGREGHAGFAAGWSQFMGGQGIQGKPIEARKLRELLLHEGIDPGTNEFSRGIIATREE